MNMHIPINARVDCTDGECGTSSCIVADPTLGVVTHLAVREKAPPHNEYLVPLANIAETTSNLITLNITITEIRQLPQFTETEFITVPDYTGEASMMAWPYAVPQDRLVPIDHELVPHGKLSVGRGTLVEATDETIGSVTDFLVDPESGHISHLVVQTGYLLNQTELTLPVSAIDRVEENTVYLKLDTQAIGSLPVVPIKRSYGRLAKGAENVELVVLAFNGADTARAAGQTLKQLDKDKTIKLLNLAILEKNVDGKLAHKEAEDVGPRQGTLFGAITGGIIGLVAGPIGAVVGAAAGAATGRAAAGWIDMGFSDQALESLQNAMGNDSSAVVILIEQQYVDSSLNALADFEGHRLQQSMTDEMVSQLLAASGSESDG